MPSPSTTPHQAFPSSHAAPGTRRSRSTVIIPAASKGKKKQYGTGRADLGLNSSPDGPDQQQQQQKPGPSPTLGEYLTFGKLIGERVQDVKRQLDLNGQSVVVDKQSAELLRDWEDEQENAYAMFESIMSHEQDLTTTGAQPKSISALMKNKNKATDNLARISRFVEREYRSEKPMTAAEKKLAKIRQRTGTGIDTVQAMKLFEGALDEVGGLLPPTDSGDRYDRIEAVKKPRAVPALSSKPARPGQEEEESDEEEVEEDTYEEAISENFEEWSANPTNQRYISDFANAMADSESFSSRAKPPKPSGVVRLSSSDLKRTPATPSLQGKPIAPSAAAVSRAEQEANPSLVSKPLPAKKPSKERDTGIPSPSPVLDKPANKKKVSLPSQPSPTKPPTPALGGPPKKPVAVAAETTTSAAAAEITTNAPNLSTENALPVVEDTPPTQVEVQREKSKKPEITASMPSWADPLSSSDDEGRNPITQEELSFNNIITSEPSPSGSTPIAPLKPSKKLSAAVITEAERQERRRQNVHFAEQAMKDNAIFSVTVWSSNAAGVLVKGAGLSGFVPLSELGPIHSQAVRREEERLIQGGAPVDATTRRSAMQALMHVSLSVLVLQADEASGRVIMSERAVLKQQQQQQLPASAPSAEALAAAALRVGQVVPATVMNGKPFGVFVQISVQTDEGEENTVGLVHASELSWEPVADIYKEFVPGQQVQAQILFVDPSKGRIFLSFRRAQPNPLLETLDSLLASRPDSPFAKYPSTSTNSRGVRETLDADTDLRPILGDLDSAVAFCKRLRTYTGVISVVLGVRLQSRASSQELEVYLAKGQTERGRDVAGVVHDYKLVMRQGLDVQEFVVTTTLDREDMKQLAAVVVASMASEVDAAA